VFINVVACNTQCYSIAYLVNLTSPIYAWFSVIDLIAIADIKPLLGAIPPDGVLNEPRKSVRKLRVELPGIDLSGDRLDDLSAAARSVTGNPVAVAGAEPVQNAGPVQEIVHQGVDRDHVGAEFDPPVPVLRCAEKEHRQGHGEDLVGNAVDLSERIEESRFHGGQPIRAAAVGSGRRRSSIQPTRSPPATPRMNRYSE
jgi:hypothetical protein